MPINHRRAVRGGVGAADGDGHHHQSRVGHFTSGVEGASTLPLKLKMSKPTPLERPG